MSVIEEIFNTYFGTLSKEKSVPNNIVEELQKLTSENIYITEEQVSSIVSKGCADDSINQD